MNQNREELSNYLLNKDYRCRLYRSIPSDEIHEYYKKESNISVISGSYLLYLMGKSDSYNDIDVFIYMNSSYVLNRHVYNSDSLIQTIQCYNIILPSDNTVMHFGKYIALTHDLDCVRFFGVYNYENKSMDIYGTRMGFVSLITKTNHINVYSVLHYNIISRAKKYESRGFKYKLEDDEDRYSLDDYISESNNPYHDGEQNAHSMLMFKHGIDYRPYSKELDLNKVEKVYSSDIAEYTSTHSLSSLYLLLTSINPILDQYKYMIEIYKEKVIGSEMSDKEAIDYILTKI
jgi:hypothetical protein